MLASSRRVGAQTLAPAPAPFHAPLFSDIVTGLKADERYVVLDLGTTSTEFLSLFARTRCRVEVIDLAHFGGVSRLNSARRGHGLDKAADTLLPKQRDGEAIDLVFCWDLPNYLSLDALAALMRAIGRRAAPGAVAHALIAYSDKEMKDCPARFVPVTDDHLVDRSAPGESVPAPRYSPEDLRENMAGWMIERARLLSNGLQEYRFRF